MPSGDVSADWPIQLMYLERLLQINMALLAALGTLLMGMGERDALMPLLMLLAAPASVIITDVKRWFRLNRTAANLLGLAIVAVSLRETLRFEADAQLAVIPKLLVFLQLTLLFQEKDARIYWQLIMLGLSQVVVAALFNQGVWFGVLLVADLLAGLLALALLCVVKQMQLFRPAEATSAAVGTALRQSTFGPRAAARSAAKRTATTARRWPLGELAPAFSSTPAVGKLSGAAWELFGRVCWMGLGTVALTLVLFATVPRLGHTAWRGAVVGQRQTVGFSDTVSLGELGTIIESREEVLRLQLLDPQTEKPIKAGDELYLRGAVLLHYGLRGRGQWSGASSAASRPRPLEPPLDPQSNLLLQRIEIQPLDRPELFCIYPFRPLETTAEVQFDPGTQRLQRDETNRRRVFVFVLGTTGIAEGRQAELVPCGPWGLEKPSDWAISHLLQTPNLPSLAQLARQWERQSALPPENHIGRAKALASRLRSSGMFTYSLVGQPRRLDLDPIEDFLTENRAGHCEYFATALALMLRSRGIPSRVILGYRTDQWNDLGKYYQVRQLHAHAWVEAYIAPQYLPKHMLDSEDRRWADGAWLRLEATPAAADSSSSLLDKVTAPLDYLQSLWSDYVLDMNRQRQWEAIYGPVLAVGKEVWRCISDPGWWADLLRNTGARLGVAAEGLLGRLAAPLGFAAVVICCAAIVVLVRRRWFRFAAARRVTRRARSKAGRQVEFYRRLEQLLAQAGLRRAPGQTPLEFAVAAGEKLRQSIGRPDAAEIPVHVVELYYRVRFGYLAIDESESSAVEEQIRSLAGWIATQRPKRPAAKRIGSAILERLSGWIGCRQANR